MSKELYAEMRYTISVAKQLGYKPSVISLLQKASTSTELSRIMLNARKGVIK